jgi:hypothetical protein
LDFGGFRVSVIGLRVFLAGKFYATLLKSGNI